MHGIRGHAWRALGACKLTTVSQSTLFLSLCIPSVYVNIQKLGYSNCIVYTTEACGICGKTSVSACIAG